MKVESPAEKKSWYPKALAGIALLALLGFLYCHFFAPAPPRPLLTPEEFEKAIDDVSLNIPELLNESEGSLLTRCVFAFKESRIPVPYHRRKRFLVLTPMEEAILGQENVRQLKEKEVFYEDEADARRVESLLEKLKPVLPEAREIPYFLAYTSAVNAFCLIDGTLVVTKGILETMGDEELFYVIAHEAGHAVARHGGEDFTKAIAVKVMGNMLFGAPAPVVKKTASLEKALALEAFHLLECIGFQNPYSRIQEDEADALAILFMKKAGLSPRDAIAALEKLTLEEGEDALWARLLSTHPMTRDRIARIQRFLDFEGLGGETLESTPEDGQGMALDWHAEFLQLLNDVKVTTQKVEGAEKEVWFIPGIFMCPSEKYFPMLQEAFPGCNLTVLEWEPESHTWTPTPEKLEYRTRYFGRYLRLLLEKEGEKRNALVLAGHSLGGLAVAEACQAMAKNGETVQKVILMGAAIPCDDGELLDACEKASQAPPWNLYSDRDHVLKYVYRSLFHKTALGFCGASAKQARMKEYLLDTLQPKEKIRDKVTSHAFRRYVAGIPDILSGRLLESTVKIDFHRIAQPRAWGLPIPQTGAKVAESYQGWNFTYYVGGMPKLKFPKLRRQKKPEDTAPSSTEEPGEPDGETEESAGEAGENEAPRPEEESGEEEGGDEALEKARRAHGFAIFNPLGELCFYSMDFHTAYARFTEIREALDKVSQGGPYPQE